MRLSHSSSPREMREPPYHLDGKVFLCAEIYSGSDPVLPMSDIVAVAFSPRVCFFAVGTVLLAFATPYGQAIISRGRPDSRPSGQWFRLGLITSIGAIFLALGTFGFPERAGPDIIGANITEPTEGDTVPRSLIVRGRSVHAGDGDLVVYVYAPEAQRYYVQGWAAVGANGQWSASVKVGGTEAGSNGAPFSIGVLAHKGPLESEYTELPVGPLDRVAVIRATVSETPGGGGSGGGRT
jgi:hypothetical protein